MHPRNNNAKNKNKIKKIQQNKTKNITNHVRDKRRREEEENRVVRGNKK
jgi:hypothetical protein